MPDGTLKTTWSMPVQHPERPRYCTGASRPPTQTCRSTFFKMDKPAPPVSHTLMLKTQIPPRNTFFVMRIARVPASFAPMRNASGVFDSPFFAVSSEKDGSYEIGKVPAGSYKLIAWHEQFGTQSQDVTISGNEAATVNFVFKATPY